MINILISIIQDTKEIWINLTDYFFIWLTQSSPAFCSGAEKCQVKRLVIASTHINRVIYLVSIKKQPPLTIYK
jgi:hypothetical protein